MLFDAVANANRDQPISETEWGALAATTPFFKLM